MWPFKKQKTTLTSGVVDYESFAEKCVEELKILQDKFQNDHNLTWYENWSYNQTTGLLTFSTNGKELNFRYFDVGSFSEKSKTWNWSWDNASALDSVKEMARSVKEFGQRSNFPVTAQKIKDRYVECSAHEYRRKAFVCKHLNDTTKVGFEEAFETFEGMDLLEDDDFQAWCDECEAVRQKEGEWNDKSMAFAEIKLVCERCYFEMKLLNLG